MNVKGSYLILYSSSLRTPSLSPHKSYVFYERLKTRDIPKFMRFIGSG